jgi:hypothetical protein
LRGFSTTCLHAILSHTWGPDEVSHQDFLAERKKGGAGYAKILACCNYAAKDGKNWSRNRTNGHGPWDLLWIDVCCIDELSSAELTETINSMYECYRQAEICYVYLADVTKSDEVEQTRSEFGASKCFTGGWTLQELLAPWNLGRAPPHVASWRVQLPDSSYEILKAPGTLLCRYPHSSS